MSFCIAAITPWARKSTAQGRRRVSLRLQHASQLSDRSAAACNSVERERGTKRTSSPVTPVAKRMRLVDCTEEVTGSLMEEEREHDESIEEGRDDEEDGAIDPLDPDMQVTSSYSSSSDSRRSNDEYVMEDGSDKSYEVYLEEEDIDDEEEKEEELEAEDEGGDDEMIVDKTDIITSDEGEQDHQPNLNGSSDSYERMTQFRKLSLDLCQRFEMMPLKEPAQFTNRCHGVGPAPEVWSVLCHKDEIHSICDDKFMEQHGRAYASPRRTSLSEPAIPAPRTVLIDWMQDVCWAEKLHRETFHLAVDYVDRVMAKGPKMNMKMSIRQFQLLGTTALFVAAKYEEIYPPKVEDMVQYTDAACSVEQVRSMELIILKVLEWELNVITPLHWTHLFLELLTGNPKPSRTTSARFSLLQQSDEGFFYEKEPEEVPVTTGTCDRDDFVHVAYVMDTVILHEKCRKYSNRVLAAAVMHAVYDADTAIEQVTVLPCTDEIVKEAIEFVTPIVMYCETNKEPRPELPIIEGIRPDAVHTIQQHRSRLSLVKHLDEVMEGIKELRCELTLENERRQRSAAIRIPQ